MRIHISRLTVVLVCLASLVLVPTLAQAQDQAGIAGAVRDATGGALPGATVEAASPALIEQSRTVFTDGAGNYNIINLPPGTYTVTFTLPGFNTFVREGIVFVREGIVLLATGQPRYHY